MIAKSAIQPFYRECYSKFHACLERCPAQGQILEIGSGSGFIKTFIPETITSDVAAMDGQLDMVVDALKLPFAEHSLRAIFMLNVFHHIRDGLAFLREAERCLMPNGRLYMIDQHIGPLSYPIFRFIHREGFNTNPKTLVLNDADGTHFANGAVSWLVFKRRWPLLKAMTPNLQLLRYEPHTPLAYWLAGGLKSWSLLPRPWTYRAAHKLDHLLCKIAPNLGSFVDIELMRL